MSTLNFGLDSAVEAANEAVTRLIDRPLSDVETLILKGAWERLDYDQIAAQNQYATTYISNDIAPKLWRLLSDALGEKVKKNNFKTALKRYWETELNCGAARSPHADTPDLSLPSTESLSPVAGAADHPMPVQGPAFFARDRGADYVIDESYIERSPVEKVSYETVLKPGSLLRIKAPKYMGKTSLVNQIVSLATAQHYRTVSLSFELAERHKLADLNQFLRWFCLNISRELGLPGELEEFWDEEGMGAKVSCTTYFEEYLLVQEDRPLVLCLDDVDLLFPYPHIYEDFFGLLRSWYEKARSRRIWQNLRLVLAHATDVYIRLNIHQSPFNVGVPVSLPDFTPSQAYEFAKTFQLNEEAEAIAPLLEWVGGHPYLLQLAFRQVMYRAPGSIPDLLTDIATESGLYGPHLRDLSLTLKAEPALAEVLQQVVTADEPIKLDAIAAYKLQSMGLITLAGNMAQSRCRLYHAYFAEHLEDLMS